MSLLSKEPTPLFSNVFKLNHFSIVNAVSSPSCNFFCIVVLYKGHDFVDKT